MVSAAEERARASASSLLLLLLEGPCGQQPVRRPKTLLLRASIVATEEIDFVARTGDFAPLAIGLVERQLRSARRSPRHPEWPVFDGGLAEIFRHEINNPLTGILGNAEMVLAHRERLPVADVQRLQTVVDLAVRLRETTRRLSSTWESQMSSLKSA